MEQTIKCKICGDPYKVYSYFAGDQSACPKCVERAERNMRKGWQIGTTGTGSPQPMRGSHAE